MQILSNVMIVRFRPAATPGADPAPTTGATVAQLLAAAEALNLADPDDQGRVEEGIAELLRVVGDAADPDRDGWRAGPPSAWLLAALLDAIRLARAERSGAHYGIVGPTAAGPRGGVARHGRLRRASSGGEPRPPAELLDEDRLPGDPHV
jgi:hypothetical protein